MTNVNATRLRQWVAAILVFLAGVSVPVVYDQLVAGVAVEPEEQTFLTLLNNYRIDNGLPPVTVDARLQKAAEARSQDMVDHNYFSHTSSTGEDPFTFMCRVANYCENAYKGENIAANYATAQQVFQGWKDSPGHNANMLGPYYTATGISLIRCTTCSFGYYWTSEFASILTEAVTTATPTAKASPTIVPPVVTAVPTVTAIPKLCPADFNGDRVVNGRDVLAYAFLFGPSPTYDVKFDLNNDGRLTPGDMLRMSVLFGPCPL